MHVLFSVTRPEKEVWPKLEVSLCVGGGGGDLRLMDLNHKP